MWTLSRKLAFGFTFSGILLLVIGITSYRSVGALKRGSESVAHTHQVLEAMVIVLNLLKDAETGQRGFIITGLEAFLEPYNAAVPVVARQMKALRELTADNRAAQSLLDESEPIVTAKLAELKRTIEMRRTQGFEPTAKVVADGEGKRAMDTLRGLFTQIEREERQLLIVRAEEAATITSSTEMTIIFGTLVCLLIAIGVGVFISRSLSDQIAENVQRVQSSSTELQSAANQQASSAKELATSMSEITTTLTELLASSRQIAESAQRVTQIAGQTADAARSGDTTVDRGQESIGGIRRQVDLVVSHMLDLGKKSQQIGAVLDIVGELAEQTNILAINATIEASGAGESGKRFGVVADEIRKLADRVQASTKEVRALIEDIRTSVNTTVMATETGSKSVDIGARHFVDVATAFKQITALISTTSDAAREIGLSTKQQTTAVEQVSIAISSVAQASRETEVSTGQTLQTASQLASLSRSLLSIVQPEASA